MLFEFLILDVGPVAENVAPGPPIRPLADLHPHSTPLRENAVGHHRAGPEAPVGCSGKRDSQSVKRQHSASSSYIGWCLPLTFVFFPHTFIVARIGFHTEPLPSQTKVEKEGVAVPDVVVAAGRPSTDWIWQREAALKEGPGRPHPRRSPPSRCGRGACTGTSPGGTAQRTGAPRGPGASPPSAHPPEAMACCTIEGNRSKWCPLI